MNLIQQLAEYQNAPIQSLEAAKRGANPAISPWVAGAILNDRIEKQKRMQTAQGAAMGPQPTVSAEQDQELAGIMGLPGAAQAQPAPQGAPVMAAEGGLMQAKVNPDIYDYCGGGIIAFNGEDQSDVPSAEEAIRKRNARNVLPGDTGYEGQSIGEFLSNVLGSAVSSLKGSEERTLAKQRAEAIQRENAKKEAALSPLMRDEYRPRRSEDQQREADAAARSAAAPKRAASTDPNTITPPAAPNAPAKPAAPGAPAKPTGGLMDLLTSSPEWADLEAARKKQFDAPKLGQTAGELAAEKAAHLKAQGITEMPWETAAKQTAELRRMMKSDDEERAARLEADKGRPTFHRLVANMGAGSFGQSSAPSLRAQVKHEDDVAAETQRIKELRYNQNLKLNEIEAKAKELRYNEAIGDVAAAQKNRKDIAELQRGFEKDKVAIAQGQAGLRERAGGEDLRAATQKYGDDLRALTQRAATTSSEKRLKIDGLKALESNIVTEMAPYAKAAFTPEAKAMLAQLQTQLKQVRQEIAKESGLGTLGATPGGAPSGGKIVDWNSIGK